MPSYTATPYASPQLQLESLDLVGPLACTEEGNKYIIVVTDYFTKWPEARAAPTKEAFHVANFLFDLFLRHGCPDITISDQGKEFCNQVNLVILLPACKIIANH